MSRAPEISISGSHAAHSNIQENVLEESQMMVRDTRQRLEAALGELQNLVVSGVAVRCPFGSELAPFESSFMSIVPCLQRLRWTT